MSEQLLAVTAIGVDRPGIVAGVTGALFEQGCNLEDVSSTILAGHFSMMVLVRAPDAVSAAGLEGSLRPVAEEFDLVVAVREVGSARVEISPATHMVSVYGSDRPGIVYKVTSALAAADVNVTDLTSRVIGDPEDPVYALMLEVAAPADLDLQPLLDELGSDLAVEVSVHPIDADVL